MIQKQEWIPNLSLSLDKNNFINKNNTQNIFWSEYTDGYFIRYSVGVTLKRDSVLWNQESGKKFIVYENSKRIMFRGLLRRKLYENCIKVTKRNCTTIWS